MGRYSVSGANATILDATEDATGAAGDPTTLLGGQQLMGRAITAGRAFYLRSAWFYNASTAVAIRIFDACAGTNPTGSTSRIVVVCASGQTTMIDIPAPGLKFTTGVVASKEGSAPSGSFGPGYCGGNGYEEE